jgi:hypothetical protein
MNIFTHLKNILKSLIIWMIGPDGAPALTILTTTLNNPIILKAPLIESIDFPRLPEDSTDFGVGGTDPETNFYAFIEEKDSFEMFLTGSMSKWFSTGVTIRFKLV